MGYNYLINKRRIEIMTNYNVIAINKRNERFKLNATPMSHHEACVFLSKFTPYAGITRMLEVA